LAYSGSLTWRETYAYTPTVVSTACAGCPGVGVSRAAPGTEPQAPEADWSHYLVCPARSAELPAFTAFQRWLHAEAMLYAAELAQE